jgi:hypothetical protein
MHFGIVKLCMKVMQKVDDLPLTKHHGEKTMMVTLSKSLYWANMKEDMEYYVHMYVKCQCTRKKLGYIDPFQF